MAEASLSAHPDLARGVHARFYGSIHHQSFCSTQSNMCHIQPLRDMNHFSDKTHTLVISGSAIKPKVHGYAVCCKISVDSVCSLQKSAISIWTLKWAAWAAQDWSSMTRIRWLPESGNYPGRLIHCRQKAIKWHRRSGMMPVDVRNCHLSLHPWHWFIKYESIL